MYVTFFFSEYSHSVTSSQTISTCLTMTRREYVDILLIFFLFFFSSLLCVSFLLWCTKSLYNKVNTFKNTFKILPNMSDMKNSIIGGFERLKCIKYYLYLSPNGTLWNSKDTLRFVYLKIQRVFYHCTILVAQCEFTYYCQKKKKTNIRRYLHSSFLYMTLTLIKSIDNMYLSKHCLFLTSSNTMKNLSTQYHSLMFYHDYLNIGLKLVKCRRVSLFPVVKRRLKFVFLRRNYEIYMAVMGSTCLA